MVDADAPERASAWLPEALSRARAALPGTPIDVESLGAFITERAGDVSGTELPIEDLAWAWALGRGDREAILRFEREVLSAIDRVVARVDPERSFADAVRHELRVRVLVGDGAEPPRILGYAGRGPLKHWTLVAAIRLAYDLKRRRGDREDPVEDLDLVLFDDPERDFAKRESRALLKGWIEEGLRALDDRRRGVLHLYFVEDVSSEAIARMYGVHRGTVARWIEEIRTELRAHVRRRALGTPGLGPEDVESLLRAADGHLSLSLSLLELRPS